MSRRMLRFCLYLLFIALLVVLIKWPVPMEFLLAHLPRLSALWLVIGGVGLGIIVAVLYGRLSPAGEIKKHPNTFSLTLSTLLILLWICISVQVLYIFAHRRTSFADSPATGLDIIVMNIIVLYAAFGGFYALQGVLRWWARRQARTQEQQVG